VQTARKARTRFPDDPQAFLMLAVSLTAAKHNDEALAAFAEAQKNYESNGLDDYLNAEFYYRYGGAAEQANQVEKAAELLKKSIDMNPRNASEAYNYLGYMWAERGIHLDEALDMVRKALEEEPDKAEYQDSLGWVYYMKGEYEKALEELQQAASKLKPEDAVVFDHLAETLEKLGKADDAVRYWQKAIALDQDDADPKKLQEKIDAAQKKAKTPGAPPEKPSP
jgi:tetratricopeptide (TPR) repeat protein